MVLTTHAIVGAAIASSLPASPAFGLLLAFGSHFALDAIPHWDYPLRSIEEHEDNYLKNDFVLSSRSLFDLAKIGLDFVLGFGLVSIFFSRLEVPWWLLLTGALLGILPDFLQFLYFKLRVEPFTSIQRFHHFVHTRHKLKGRPLIGVLSQLGLIIAVVLIVYYS